MSSLKAMLEGRLGCAGAGRMVAVGLGIAAGFLSSCRPAVIDTGHVTYNTSNTTIYSTCYILLRRVAILLAIPQQIQLLR